MSRKTVVDRMEELDRERKLAKIRYLVVGVADGDTYKYYVEDVRSGNPHQGEDATYFAGPFKDVFEARKFMEVNRLNK